MRIMTHFLCWCISVAPAETQTTEAERNALAKYANGKSTLVEIGVWHGVTTTLLRSAMAPHGTLYAVDPFVPGRLKINFQQVIAHSEVRKVSRGEVCWIRSSNKEALQQAIQKGLKEVEFIFIDGDHSYEGLQRDWENWSPLIGSGGIVALHDSRSTSERDLAGAGSTRFTQEVVLKDERFTVIETIDSLTLLERR